MTTTPSTFYLKQGDTSPYLRGTAYDSDDNVIDVTGASILFKMRRIGGSKVVDATAAIVTASAGLVEYRWASGDTDVVGEYEGEFEITFASGKIETIPNKGYIPITIGDDI